jgi:CRISPR-associated protein Csb2
MHLCPAELSDPIKMMRDTLPGRILMDNEGHETCRLVEARSNAVFERYTNSGIEFETITPVVLPHHLTKNGRLNHRRVSEIGKWFVESRLPEPIGLSVGFQQQQFFALVYIQHLPQYRLRVRFAREATGPIAIGLGRFYGLGIFANRARIGAGLTFATNAQNADVVNVKQSGISEAVALAR